MRISLQRRERASRRAMLAAPVLALALSILAALLLFALHHGSLQINN